MSRREQIKREGGVGRVFRATALATSLALAGCGTSPERHNGAQNNNTEIGSDITAGAQNAEIEVYYDTKFQSEIKTEIKSFFSECNGTPDIKFTSQPTILEDGTQYIYEVRVTTKDRLGAEVPRNIQLILSTEALDNRLKEQIYSQLSREKEDWIHLSVYGGN